MGLLIALILMFPDPKSVGAFTQADGGITTRVWCDGVSTSSSGYAYVNVVVDAGRLDINNFPAVYPVTGTFYQSIQPVSGTLTCNVGTVPVTGTFYQTVQPVVITDSGISINNTVTVAPHDVRIVDSGISITNFPATTAVTGTFWQVTQPVSGTFFQSIQPIVGNISIVDSGVSVLGSVTVLAHDVRIVDSGVSITNFPSLQYVSITDSGISINNSITVLPLDVHLADSGVGITNWPVSQAVTGTFWQVTQPVSVAATVQSVQYSRAVAYAASPTPVAATVTGPSIMDLEGIPYVNISHPRTVSCQFAAAATTTLLELTGCAAVASNSYWITDWRTCGGIANAATVPALLRSGTGANCVTGTVTLDTCWHTTASCCDVHLTTPIKVTVGHAICGIDATVGTKSFILQAKIAP